MLGRLLSDLLVPLTFTDQERAKTSARACSRSASDTRLAFIACGLGHRDERSGAELGVLIRDRGSSYNLQLFLQRD
jgi:hypothetical protein